MAFVPDQAVRRAHEIKPLAFTLYVYYCMRRNKDTGVCFPSLKLTAEETGINYCYCSQMRTYLAEKGWIEVVGTHEIRPLMGFETVEKSLEIPKIPETQKFGNSKDSTGEGLEIPNVSLDIPNKKFGNSKTPSYIEPAQLTREIEPVEEAPGDIDDDPLKHWAVLEYNRCMRPNPGLDLYQSQLIAATVTDRAVWDATLMIFSGSDHRGRLGNGRNAGAVLDRYTKELRKAQEECQRSTGKPLPVRQETPEERLARQTKTFREQNGIQ